MSKTSRSMTIKSLLYCFCVLLIVLLAAACSPGGRNGSDDNDSGGVGTKKYSVSELQADFQAIRNSVEKNHPLLISITRKKI